MHRYLTIVQYPQQVYQDLLPIRQSTDPSLGAICLLLALTRNVLRLRGDLQIPQFTSCHTLLQLRTLYLRHIDDLLGYPCQARYVQAV